EHLQIGAEPLQQQFEERSPCRIGKGRVGIEQARCQRHARCFTFARQQRLSQRLEISQVRRALAASPAEPSGEPRSCHVTTVVPEEPQAYATKRVLSSMTENPPWTPVLPTDHADPALRRRRLRH